MNYERPYYEDINYHPLMFYVIFGAKEEELEISRERHNLDEVPEGLNMNMFTREQHSEYMDNLIGGTLGKLLKEKQPELYEKIQKENVWAIVNREIKQDDNLKYFHSLILKDYNVDINTNISAPITKGDALGKITYNIDGITYESDLIAENDIIKSNLFEVILQIIFAIIVLILIAEFLSHKHFKQKRNNNMKSKKKNLRKNDSVYKFNLE